MHHLINRRLVNKKVPIRKEGGYGIASFTLRFPRMEKIKKMIKDNYGDIIRDER